MFLKLFFLIAIYFGQNDGACPLGFMSHGDSCYHFSTDTENFISALGVCRELGAQLIEIETSAEDHFIMKQCENRGESYWIGLSDLRAPGHYIWMTSKTELTPSSYNGWEPGQPDHDDGDENCVNLEENFGWSWNDLSCHLPQRYICEMKNGEMEFFG